MYIDQQNRNFTEEFRWNDASLLTRAMILGAEAITDCKIDTQIKTQLAIDEEATSVYDKLYPGDFRIQVNPSILDDINLTQKCADMESGDKSNRTWIFFLNNNYRTKRSYFRYRFQKKLGFYK